MVIKRFFDILASLLGLVFLAPLLIIISLIIFLNDFHNPFYLSYRAGKNGKSFKLIKFRSMKINADQTGVGSTANDDERITKIGKMIRKYKLDELPQLINVFLGQMSLVGPRPQLERDVEIYTIAERLLLKVAPGITDFSSIIFSDEGQILNGSKDPDLDYNQLIRPWKSRLGILYIKNQSLFMDFILIFLTLLAIVKRRLALRMINKILGNLSSNKKLISISSRKFPLKPYPPPGADSIVQNN